VASLIGEHDGLPAAEVAQRRQLEAHAHAQALLYRNSATALEQLSIHPAAVQRNNGARRYEARRNFAGRR
jgi:hypothetical protein